jgi:hypothetical protein
MRSSSIAVWLVIGTVACASYAGIAWTLFGIDSQRCWGPGCPGEVPLGTALALGTAVGNCGSAPNSSTPVCVYAFSVTAGSGIAPIDVSLELLGANINDESNLVHTVTLESPSGCAGAVWSWPVGTTGGNWAPAGSSTCAGPSITAPLVSGQVLVLEPASDSSLGLNDRGYSLVAQGIGSYVGTVGAPIL